LIQLGRREPKQSLDSVVTAVVVVVVDVVVEVAFEVKAFDLLRLKASSQITCDDTVGGEKTTTTTTTTTTATTTMEYSFTH
jgi:hypothetical protein